MAHFVDALANSLPDLAILVISAIAFSLFGGGIALASNWLWFRHWEEHSPYEEKLGDTAHVSLLGFAAFVLALLITNGVSNLSKTEENVRKEALSVHRLSRELDALGPSAHDAKQALGAYRGMSRMTNGRVSPRCRTPSHRWRRRTSMTSGLRFTRFNSEWTRQILLATTLERNWRRSKLFAYHVSRPRQPTFRNLLDHSSLLRRCGIILKWPRGPEALRYAGESDPHGRDWPRGRPGNCAQQSVSRGNEHRPGCHSRRAQALDLHRSTYSRGSQRADTKPSQSAPVRLL